MEANYKKIGLKVGIEIHQQLDTNKLFCNCPSILRRDEPDFEVKRKLHAVVGESGEVDDAAKYEASLDKEFIYQGYDTNCLVELDEEPPHEINKEALKITLQISILLNAKIFPLTQIMRKTVIDGSNTGGFQRTVLVARDGFVETEQGKVGIESICLEEDAAKIISKENNKVVYRLDRLGIPLIEIATAPDIKSPEQAKEVALHIGNILRSCKVKRGLGTIRQDVNVSIRGHPRVEVKGVQDPKLIAKTINSEIQRQLNLIKSKKTLRSEVRKSNPDGSTSFMRPMPGAARMYPETDLPLLKISKSFIDNAKKDLPKLKSSIEEELQKQGLHKEMIKLLFKQNKLEEFIELLKIIKKPSLIAKILLIFPKEIARREKIDLKKIDKILEDNYSSILTLVVKGKIPEAHIKDVMTKIVKGEGFDETAKTEKIDLGDIEEKILKIIKDKPGLSEKAYMGLVMKEFKGKISGRDSIDFIRKYVKD